MHRIDKIYHFFDKMINTFTANRRTGRLKTRHSIQAQLTDNLIESRDFVRIQTIYNERRNDESAESMDMDLSGQYLIVGRSNRSSLVRNSADCYVDFLVIKETFSKSYHNFRFVVEKAGKLNQVQWSPSGEQAFSVLCKRIFNSVDSSIMCANFKHETAEDSRWSDWNIDDRNLVSICCGSEVQLVDLRQKLNPIHRLSPADGSLTTNCVWSKRDSNCLVVGNFYGAIRIYDKRFTSRPQMKASHGFGLINGISFTKDHSSLIVSQGLENHLKQWEFKDNSLRYVPKFKTKDQFLCSSELYTGYLREETGKFWKCQFYLTDKHIYLPERIDPMVRHKLGNQISIFDINSGKKVNSIRTKDQLEAAAIIGRLPDSPNIYVLNYGLNKIDIWNPGSIDLR